MAGVLVITRVVVVGVVAFPIFQLHLVTPHPLHLVDIHFVTQVVTHPIHCRLFCLSRQKLCTVCHTCHAARTHHSRTAHQLPSQKVMEVSPYESIVSETAAQPQQLPLSDQQDLLHHNFQRGDFLYIQGSLDALTATEAFINVWLDKRRLSSLGSNIPSFQLQVPSPVGASGAAMQASVHNVPSSSLRQIWSERPAATAASSSALKAVCGRSNSRSTTASTIATLTSGSSYNKRFASPTGPTTTGQLKSPAKTTTVGNAATAASNYHPLLPSSASSVSSEPFTQSSIPTTINTSAADLTSSPSLNSFSGVHTKSAPLRASPPQATTAATSTMTAIGTSTSATTPIFSTSNSNSMCGNMRIRSASGRGLSGSRRRVCGNLAAATDISSSTVPFLPLQNWPLQQHHTSSVRYLSGDASLPLSPAPSSISRSSTLHSNRSGMRLRRSSEGDVRRLSGFPLLSASNYHNYHLPPTSVLGLSLLPPVLETHGTDGLYPSYGTAASATASNAVGFHSYNNSVMEEFVGDLFAFMHSKRSDMLLFSSFHIFN